MSRSRKRRRRSCEPRRRRPRGGPPGRIGHAEGEAGWANGGRPQAAIAHTLGAAGRRRRQRTVEGRRHLSWTALVFEGEGHGAEAANSRRARCNTPCGEGDKSTSPPRKAGSADHGTTQHNNEVVRQQQQQGAGRRRARGGRDGLRGRKAGDNATADVARWAPAQSRQHQQAPATGRVSQGGCRRDLAPAVIYVDR